MDSTALPRDLPPSLLHASSIRRVTGRIMETGLHKLRKQAPSKAAKSQGNPFLQIFKEADRDFYKIIPTLFALAILIINNVKTGQISKAGEINPRVLKKSLGFQFGFLFLTLDLVLQF
jgi:methenyltetrahydromethanopterin cyclohydrolase